METYLDQERMKYDYENVLEYAVEQGEAKGREEGRSEGLAEGEARGEAKGVAKGRSMGLAEGKRETAKNMLNKGFEYAIISEITGLSQGEIQSL